MRARECERGACLQHAYSPAGWAPVSGPRRSPPPSLDWAQVNKIREVPGHESILVTHTDAPEVLVWSLERQPNRASDKARAAGFSSRGSRSRGAGEEPGAEVQLGQ